MFDDHLLFALDAILDVMVLYNWVAHIPTVWFLVDGLMARISCIRVQPQCSSISKALTSPLNGKLSLLSQFHIVSTLIFRGGLADGLARWELLL